MSNRHAPFLLGLVLSLSGAMSLTACGGIPKLDPLDVTKLMVDSHGGKFCPWGEVKLDLAVVLKDGKIRATNGLDDSVRLDAQKNFTYKASAGKIAVRTDGVFFVPPQDYAYLLENDVTAEAKLVDRPDLPGATVTFVPDFTCKERVSLGGYGGTNGESGGGGAHGSGSALFGGNGGDAGDGTGGYDAGPLEITLGVVDTPKRGQLVIARTVAIATRETDVRLFAPGAGRLVVDNSGGSGGSGGDGGYGGDGGSYVDGVRCDAGDGGDGGSGGNGADGGNGGPITLFVDASHPELQQVLSYTNGGGAGGRAGSAGQGGNKGWAEATNSAGVVVCRRDGRPGRNGFPGRGSGRSGAAGPRAIVSSISNPFPQGVASVDVRATSSNTDLSTAGARVKPTGSVTATGTGHGTVAVGPNGVTVTANGTATAAGSFGKPPSAAPTAAQMFAQLKGTNLLRVDNKSTMAICEVYPLDQKTKVPVTKSAITSALAPNQSRDIARWGPPSAAAGATPVRFGVRTCDGKMEAVAMVPINESTTIVVYNAIPNTFPPHSVSAVLAKP
ncbi:hypothetical protein BH09MYX1_BH09MYX1_46860 [soil metagenome]